MRIFYLIAAHNESNQFEILISRLRSVPETYAGSQLVIVDNGSDDDSRTVLKKLSIQYSWVQAFFEREKGMGVAFRLGLNELQKLNLRQDDWIAFSAVDLPFGFSDLESFLKLRGSHPDAILFIGSKSHPDSQISRSFKRAFASWCFRCIRRLFLGMKTRDPQGTLFLRADHLDIVHQIQSKDYFFTTELVYYIEKISDVVEMPVVLNQDIRPSKVNLLKDGLRAICQTLVLRFRQKN